MLAGEEPFRRPISSALKSPSKTWSWCCRRCAGTSWTSVGDILRADPDREEREDGRRFRGELEPTIRRRGVRELVIVGHADDEEEESRRCRPFRMCRPRAHHAETSGFANPLFWGCSLVTRRERWKPHLGALAYFARYRRRHRRKRSRRRMRSAGGGDGGLVVLHRALGDRRGTRRLRRRWPGVEDQLAPQAGFCLARARSERWRSRYWSAYCWASCGPYSLLLGRAGLGSSPRDSTCKSASAAC